MIGILVIAWSSEAAGQLTVVPDSKHLTIARGSSLSFPLLLNGTAKNVTLRSSGNIANWISFDTPNLDVDKKAEITVFVDVPRSASYTTYNGDIYVETLGFQKRVSIFVNVSSQTISGESRSINLGDFTVSYATGPETVAEKDNLRIERGYFTDLPSSFAAILSEENLPMVIGGHIEIVIDQTNGLGNLIVEVNGNETHNQKAGVGEIAIDLTKDQIKKSNSVVLRAGTPGLTFWSSSVYDIGSVKFIAEYNGTTFEDINFVLDNTEVVNFQSGRLSFVVEKYDVNKLNNLMIKINDQTFFDGIPTLVYFTKSFGNEINLNMGVNTISFSVEPDTFYELKDVTLTIIRNI
jgi:hypothetical protein